MKKLQYNYLPSEGASSVNSADARKTTPKASPGKTARKQPTEETVNKLNAIAREYPFCACFKPGGTSLL